MPQFMLLLHEEPADFASFSPEDIQAVIAEYSTWSQQFARGGMKLKDEGGKHISMSGDDIRVTDGPYAEAKEVIGGFFEIEAAGYAEAIEICKTCPHIKYGGRIELREVEPTE
jgi:hypothetical protein